MPKTSKLEKLYKQQIVDLYESGVSAVMIAKQFKVTTTTVTTLLKKCGVVIRVKKEAISIAWDRRKRDVECFEAYTEALSNRLRGRKFTTESKNKMSKSRAEGIASGNIRHRTYGRQGYKHGLFCRSSYESDFVDWCFVRNVKVESCRYIIPYIYEGSEHTYVPDFYLPDLKLVVEVKPLQLKNVRLVQTKASAAKKFLETLGIAYTFVTELTIYKKPVFREDYNL